MEDIYTYKVYDITVPGGYTCKPEVHTALGGQVRYSGSVKCVNVIKYIGKPCKEFDSLNKYLTNTLKIKPLEIDSISSERVAGKRSSIFSRYDLKLLAHEPERCKRYKTELQTARKATWKASIEFKKEMDNGGRYNGRGEDRESEWYGIERHYAEISFKTQGGKEMKTITLYS